jgi:hypothetical protein
MTYMERMVLRTEEASNSNIRTMKTYSAHSSVVAVVVAEEEAEAGNSTSTLEAGEEEDTKTSITSNNRNRSRNTKVCSTKPMS